MNGTLLNTVSFSDFTDLVRKQYVTNQQMVQSNAMQLFISDYIGDGEGESKRYDEIDTETFADSKAQGADAKKAKAGIGYNKTMYSKRFAKEIDITWEMRKYNRYREVGSLLTQLNHFGPQRRELDLTHRLTFCNATSYVNRDGDTVDVSGGDGYAIVTNSHTLKFSPTTWSNRLTGDSLFSRGALEGMESLAVSNILSNFGERRIKSFNTIITSDDPFTCNEVRQFLASTSDVDQNNSGVMNVYKGKYRHVELPWLATTATGARDATKRHWWFLAATGQGDLGWQAYYGEWEAPHMKDTPMDGKSNEDFHNDNWTYAMRMAYGICVVTGRGLIGSLPTSS